MPCGEMREEGERVGSAAGENIDFSVDPVI